MEGIIKIDYSNTQDTFQALQGQFLTKSIDDILFAMKKYKSEKMICDYLSDLLPF
jgi:hypothetical protein